MVKFRLLIKKKKNLGKNRWDLDRCVAIKGPKRSHSQPQISIINNNNNNI